MPTPDNSGSHPCECSFSAAPASMGTVLPCGCIARAINVTCATCGWSDWAGTYTRTQVGEHTWMRGSCPACGADISGLAVVEKHPRPQAIPYKVSLN